MQDQALAITKSRCNRVIRSKPIQDKWRLGATVARALGHFALWGYYANPLVVAVVASTDMDFGVVLAGEEKS